MTAFYKLLLTTWTVIMLVFSGSVWFSSLGFVTGTEYTMLVSLRGQMAMFMVWVALFGLWYVSNDKQAKLSVATASKPE